MKNESMESDNCRKILRYSLPPEVLEHEIEMPLGSNIIHVGAKGNQVSIWVMTFPFHESKNTEMRTFILGLTGRNIRQGAKYIGTAALHDNTEFYHVFEITK